MIRSIVLVIFAISLIACGTASKKMASESEDRLEAQVQREAALGEQTAWRLVGRLAVSDGHDGGSGRIEWLQDGARYEITLQAPVTRRGWRLIGEEGYARLEGVDGGPFVGESAEALLQQYVGWVIPHENLVAWVRGLRAKGRASMTFRVDGLPASIAQNGWVIEYRDYASPAPLALPTRVFASQGERRVRLQIEAWTASESK